MSYRQRLGHNEFLTIGISSKSSRKRIQQNGRANSSEHTLIQSMQQVRIHARCFGQRNKSDDSFKRSFKNQLTRILQPQFFPQDDLVFHMLEKKLETPLFSAAHRSV